MEIPNLNKVFQESSKTKKVTVKDGILMLDAITHAHSWLLAQEEYNRIEFKFGKCYIVLAKLKENE